MTDNLHHKVINRSLTTELKTSYLNYAMSVIISRALPEVRDGLKPVHRRILYAMHQLGLVYNRPFKKCATVVGQVISSYHPHGDMAIYESLVRMAQTFSLRYPLIDGQGNFGSMDGDKAAAYRYTEARMTKIADELLVDINKETVDFNSNFDDTKKEPSVLPSAIPNLLINGSSGIAVGMATNFPPHNLSEVIEATIYYIDQQDCSIADLSAIIKGPDFPTGGIIHGAKGIKDAYHLGRGSFKIRSKLTVEDYKKREAIIISEIPFQVNKAEMIQKTAQLVKNDVIKGIGEIRDESDRKGVRVVIELKREVNPQTVLNLLYKHTALEISFGYNGVALVNKTPKTLNLKEIIVHFVAHRFEVVERKTRFDLKKAENRLHIVDGFINIVLPQIEKIIETIKNSDNAEKAKLNLMENFKLSEKQTQAILDMRLVRLVKLEIDKLIKEQRELENAIKNFKEILRDKNRIYQIIKTDLARIKNDYGDARKTEIVSSDLDILEEEDLIEKSDVVVSLTTSNYIKRLPIDTYKMQNRGGVGIKGFHRSSEKDLVDKLIVASTHDICFFITNKGKAYYLKAFEIPQASRLAKGVHVRTLFNFDKDEKVEGEIVFQEFDDKKSFIIVTKNGTVKRSLIKYFVNAKRRGIQAINLKEDDRVISIIDVESDEQDFMIFSKNGLATRINISDLRILGRSSMGVRGMRLNSGDEIISLLKVKNGENEILAVSELGYGKKMKFDLFSRKNRGGKGQIFFKIDEKSEKVAKVISVEKDSSLFIITSLANVIRISEGTISSLGRSTRGSKLIQLKNEQDRVIDLSVYKENGKKMMK